MNRLFLAGLFGLAALVGVHGPPSAVHAAAPARYYTAKMQGPGYAYRQYYYYSRASGGYRYHVAVYHPRYPRYVYYYNPYKGRYWGRYDLMTCGYSTLAPEDRKATLAEIPERAFPPAGPLPPAEPGDNMPMLPPPESGPPAMPAPTGGCDQR